MTDPLPPMPPWSQIEAEVRRRAHAVAPCDIASSMAIENITELVVIQIEKDRARIRAALSAVLEKRG